MKSVNRAKLDLIIAVTAFGTIGIFVRYINLPSSVIAFVRGAVGAVFLLLLLYLIGCATNAALPTKPPSLPSSPTTSAKPDNF